MYQRILVPVDGSDTSLRGLDEAIELARVTGGSINLLHAIDDLSRATGFESVAVYTDDLYPMLQEGGIRILAHAKQRAEARGVPIANERLVRLIGPLAELVVEQVRAWAIDLIVIGTHGRRGFGRLLLGSDAEQVVRIAPVPVLLIRSPEAITAVDAALSPAAEAPAPA
jgi:nucleotide-binding universal stress UspA family protein